MKVFDLTAMIAHDYHEQHKNVFFACPEFRARVVDLPAGGEMPSCKMESHVVFYVVNGSVEVTAGSQISMLH